MKTVSFYTEKGGSGKTTFNLLFASWLSYCKGVGRRVCIIAFDFPAFHLSNIRSREIMRVEGATEEDPQGMWMRRRLSNHIYEIAQLQSKKPKDADELVRFIRNAAKENTYDWMVFDFKGSFDEGDIVARLIREGLIDYLYSPISGDIMTMFAFMRLYNSIRGLNRKQFVRAFFNQVSPRNRDHYLRAREELIGAGADCSEVMIPKRDAFEKEGDEKAYRSTLYFPTNLILRKSPQIIDLFEEITHL